MINIKIRKKTKIFITILGIIIVCFTIIQIKHRRDNFEWYDLKGKVMSEHKIIDSMSIRNYGPYCSIRIETKKEIIFTEAEDIFLKILRYLNQTGFKDKLIEQHENSFRRGELACLKIDTLLVEGKGQRYEFESWDRYEYRIWEFHSEGYNKKEYDLYDYKQ